VAGLGLLALGCYAAHAAFHVVRGHAFDALWACHIAALLISAGAFFSQARWAAIGVLWLSFGNALWLVDLLGGGEFFPTSLLTHGVALAIGVIIVRRLGWPFPSWWAAALAFLVLLGVTRLLTPRAANVNLAFGVAPGWESVFPSYPVYLVLLVGAGALTFFLVELGLRRVLP
jgi:hypothetical protein